jgi:hypothetical protein
MVTWIKVVLAIPVVVVGYLWPVVIFLACMLLWAPGNPWNGLAYVLCASLVAHYPLAFVARNNLRYAGPSAETRDKLRAVAPFWLNLIFCAALVAYLGAVCHWKFVCTS